MTVWDALTFLAIYGGVSVLLVGVLILLLICWDMVVTRG